MSAQSRSSKLTIPALKGAKGQRRLVALTAYTAPWAALLDEHCDILLVGDSVGMVIYGMESTLPVDLDTMIRHGKAVAQAAHKACVLVDMPFGSYQESKEQAFRNCARVMQESGCAGVKLEGGREMAETVAFLVQRGIPVMAHVGLKPQHVHVSGGYRFQGRNPDEAESIQADARAHEAAGAFSLLIEGVTGEVAAHITSELHIPTIGIGAGKDCDGQILVTEDMAGLFEWTPSFVKRFSDLRSVLTGAAADYAEAVRNGTFPDSTHTYNNKK